MWEHPQSGRPEKWPTTSAPGVMSSMGRCNMATESLLSPPFKVVMERQNELRESYKGWKNSFLTGSVYSWGCTSSVHLLTSFCPLFDQVEKCPCKKKVRSTKWISSPSEKVIIRFYLEKRQGKLETWWFLRLFFFFWWEQTSRQVVSYVQTGCLEAIFGPVWWKRGRRKAEFILSVLNCLWRLLDRKMSPWRVFKQE